MTDLRCFNPDREPVDNDAFDVDDASAGLDSAAPEAHQEADSLRDTTAVEDSEEDDSEIDGPGGLLAELERRQDEVIAQLDALEERVQDVLRDLGVRLDDSDDAIETVA